MLVRNIKNEGKKDYLINSLTFTDNYKKKLVLLYRVNSFER